MTDTQSPPMTRRPRQQVKPVGALAAGLKSWRADAGLTTEQASAVLGIPQRTLNGIEQGRPFRYARLLMLTLAGIKKNENND